MLTARAAIYVNPRYEEGTPPVELETRHPVGLPVRSWGCAAGHAIRMATRITGRSEVAVVRAIDPERLSIIRNYCEPVEMPGHIVVRLVDFDPKTGLLDIDHLRASIGAQTAAVYFETPSYFGVIEQQGAEIASIAHAAGAEVIVGVDPISLGVLAAPIDFGADIVVGTTQPLGVHMNCGGGVSSFIATRDEELSPHQNRPPRRPPRGGRAAGAFGRAAGYRPSANPVRELPPGDPRA